MPAARYAILVGNSQFPQEPKLTPLHAPENDVDGMAEVLLAPERGAFDEVIVLKNKPQYEIVRQIQRVLNRATKNDLFVIYYSGHGKLNRSGALYLTTTDTVLSELESSAISVKSLLDFVDVSSVQRVVIILDSCYSGAVANVFSKGAVEDQLQVAASQGRGTYIMTASTGVQTSQEKEGDRYSVFTKHLINGISSGAADENGDGEITVDELYDYVHRQVRAESHQEPTRWGQDVRGRFVLSKSGREPRKERAEQLRTMLLRLADDKRIGDDILTEALKIIRLPVAGLSPVQRTRDALLDELRADRIDALQLVVAWITSAAEKPAPVPAAKEEPVPLVGQPAANVVPQHAEVTERTRESREAPAAVIAPADEARRELRRVMMRLGLVWLIACLPLMGLSMMGIY